jgi:hypothetical protein
LVNFGTKIGFAGRGLTTFDPWNPPEWNGFAGLIGGPYFVGGGGGTKSK